MRIQWANPESLDILQDNCFDSQVNGKWGGIKGVCYKLKEALDNNILQNANLAWVPGWTVLGY